MDIFINGKLLRSIKNVIPHETNEAIVIGETGGLRGAITDVVTAHFNSEMSSSEAVDMLVKAVANSK